MLYNLHLRFVLDVVSLVLIVISTVTVLNGLKLAA